MAEHSKIRKLLPDGIKKVLIEAFLGTNDRKAVSALILAIIAYLIYIKNNKSALEHVRLRD
jgi:hypothetical protein